MRARSTNQPLPDEESAQTYQAKLSSLQLALKVLLAASLRPSNPLPELVELFGYEATVKFLLVFSGKTLHVPKISCLFQAVQAASAAVTVDRGEVTADEAAQSGVSIKSLGLALAALKRHRHIRQPMSKTELELLSSVGL